MELSLGGLVGAVIGAVLGAASYAMLVPVIGRRLRAVDAARTERESEGSRIALARRSVLALDMLLFVGAGYWAGNTIGG
jgi:gas vesicle protein